VSFSTRYQTDSEAFPASIGATIATPAAAIAPPRITSRRETAV
jgi:hypothetical protein